MQALRGHALGDVPLQTTEYCLAAHPRKCPPKRRRLDPSFFVQPRGHVAEGSGSPPATGKRGRWSTMRPPQVRQPPPPAPPNDGWCTNCHYSGDGMEGAQRRPGCPHPRMGIQEHSNCSTSNRGKLGGNVLMPGQDVAVHGCWMNVTYLSSACCSRGGESKRSRKSPRREVVRSSAGASGVYPPFLGSFA